MTDPELPPTWQDRFLALRAEDTKLSRRAAELRGQITSCQAELDEIEGRREAIGNALAHVALEIQTNRGGPTR